MRLEPSCNPSTPPAVHAGQSILFALERLRFTLRRLTVRLTHGSAFRARLTLPKGSLMSIRASRALAARCCRGSVWITESDDAADHILDPQDRWQPRRHGGRVVIEAIEDAELELRRL